MILATRELRAESQEPDEQGLRCPDCGCGHLPVYYTRRRQGGYIVRVRTCRNCGRRISTREKVSGT